MLIHFRNKIVTKHAARRKTKYIHIEISTFSNVNTVHCCEISTIFDYSQIVFDVFFFLLLLFSWFFSLPLLLSIDYYYFINVFLSRCHWACFAKRCEFVCINIVLVHIIFVWLHVFFPLFLFRLFAVCVDIEIIIILFLIHFSHLFSLILIMKNIYNFFPQSISRSTLFK